MRIHPLLEVAPLAGERVRAFAGERRFLSTGGLKDESITFEPITFDNRPSRADLCVIKGDILVARMKATNKVLLIDEDLSDIIVSTGFAVLRPNEDVICSEYLLHFLRGDTFQIKKDGFCAGATQQAITNDGFSNLRVPVPSLSEQRRVAAILDKADAIRKKRNKALEASAALGKSAFLELFGDPVTNPKRWPAKQIGELVAFLTSGSRGWAQYYSEKGDLFLRIQNVGHDRLYLDDVVRVQAPRNAEAERTRVRCGDVLLSITADLGRVGVVADESAGAYINQHLAIIRVRESEVAPEYLASFLASHAGQAQITKLNRQGVKAGLNFDDIRGLKILLPPKAAQLQYVEVKRKIWEICLKQEKTAEQSNQMFAVLNKNLLL